jgi:endoglucanase
VVILEPDAIAGGCTRTRDIKGAVERLRRLKRTAVYLDAGHSHWLPAREIVKRLRASGIARADGFALNVSNYRTNPELIAYGTAIATRVKRPFVVDTSRNGQGPWTPTTSYRDPQDWCNPPGRGLGERPTTTTGVARLDAKLWIKTPGESDGQCTRGTDGEQDPEWGQVDPAAGRWFPRQAAELITLASPPLY